MKIKVFITALLIVLPSCIYPNHEKSKPAEINNNQSYNEPAEILAMAESVKDKDPKLAIEFYKEYLDLNPSKTKIRLDLIKIYQKSGKYAEAIAEYNKAIEIDPNAYYNLEESYYSLGESYEKQKKYIEAFTQYKKALEIDPNNEKFLNKFQRMASIGILRHYKEIINGEISYYEKALDFDKSNNKTLNRLVAIYNLLKMYDKAIESIKKSISFDLKENKYDSNNPDSKYKLLLSFYKKIDKIDDFKEYLKNTSFDNLESSEIYFLNTMFGNIFCDLNDYDEALKYYKNIIKINEKDPKSYFNLKAYISIGKTYRIKGEFKNAINILNKTLVDFSPNSEIYEELAITYSKENKYYEAEDFFQKAINIDNKNPTLYLELANLTMSQNMYKEAKEYYLASISLKNNMADSYVGLGLIYSKENNLDESTANYKKACELGRKDVCNSL